jgi:rod shape-determining protein MreD
VSAAQAGGPTGGIAPRVSRSRAGSPDGARLGRVAAMVLGALLVQVSLLPYINIADGIPDIIAPTVVVIAVLRGTLVGAVAGFSAGLLVELASPVSTLGVFALLYLVVGAWCGRYCEREESTSLAAPLVLSVAAALVVQFGYMLVRLMLGDSMPPFDFVAVLLVPTLVLTALLSPPVLLIGRRLLGAPYVVEPAGVR